jgi:hypothetical protein
MVSGSQEASCVSASDRTTAIVITQRTFGCKCGRNPRSKPSVSCRNNHFVNNRNVREREEVKHNYCEGKIYWQSQTAISASYEAQHSSVISGTCSGAQAVSCQTGTCAARNKPWPIHVAFVVNKVAHCLWSIQIYIHGVTLNRAINLQSLQILQQK